VTLFPRHTSIAMAMRLFAVASALACVGAMELTSANWDEATSGKTIFVKFLAPW